MKTFIELQFGLTQAWLAMCTRSSELTQEQQEKWLRLSTEVAHHYLNERQTELHELQQSEDWQKLLLLVPGLAWRDVQNRMAVAQGACQTAVDSQGALYTGWQEVLRDYAAANQALLQQNGASNTASNGATVPGNTQANPLPFFAAAQAQLFQHWTDFVKQAAETATVTSAAARPRNKRQSNSSEHRK